MTGYVSLDAYEQFCENSAEYEDYAANPVTTALLNTALRYGGGGLGIGLGAGGLGMAGIGIKGKMAEKALEEAAKENLLKGGLIGAGAIGAGILGTKAIKKLLKKKNKKPFNNPSFSEYYDYMDYADLGKMAAAAEKIMGKSPETDAIIRNSTSFKPYTVRKSSGETLRRQRWSNRRPAGARIAPVVAESKEYGPEDVHKARMQGKRVIGQLQRDLDTEKSYTEAAGKRATKNAKQAAKFHRQLGNAQLANAHLSKKLDKQSEQLGITKDQLAEAQGIIDGASVPGLKAVLGHAAGKAKDAVGGLFGKKN